VIDNGTARTSAGTAGTHGRRLIGWKAIGQFLGCTERTARRWEADRALPVHRIPGGGRSSVWGSSEELTAWLSALPSALRATLREEAKAGVPLQPAVPAPATAATPTAAAFLATPSPGVFPPTAAPPRPATPSRRPRRLITALSLAALAIVAALLWRQPPVHGVTRASEAPHTPYDDNAEARETYMSARFELSMRTADGLTAAQRGFRQLVDRYPERAAGWSGLADTYLLLREFGSMSDAVAYPQAARAARTAVALDPQLADAWLDQAFVAWWWQGDSATAFTAFATALQLEPTSAKAHHWYATARFAHGDYEESLQAIGRARALDPESRAIVADEAWMRFATGQRAEGLSTLERLAQLDGGFSAVHFYLAHIYLIELRDADFLREAQTAAALRQQAEVTTVLRLAQQRFEAGGREAMLEQLSQSEADAWARGAGSPVVVAEYRALANDRAGMLKWLGVAEARHDHNLPDLRGYPEFAAYRDDPGFEEIVRRLP